jgi:HEAT repeat protein
MPDLRCLACVAIGETAKTRLDDVAQLARQLGADTNWVVREVIANALDDGPGRTDDTALFALMERWTNDPDENVRRVPTNALMRYGRRHPDQVVGLMRRLLCDPSQYVRKNVAFCLGIMGLEHHPTLGVRDPERPRWLAGILRDWVLQETDERARWIIAETLGRTWAKRCADEARALLRELADDPHPKVRRQAAASEKALARLTA